MYVHNATHFIPANRKFSTQPVRLINSTGVLAINHNDILSRQRKRGTLACLFLCLSLLLQAAQAAPVCPARHIDRRATIKYVHDGDTVTLKSGEKIRLIGINAPEIARRSLSHTLKRAEPYANAARDYLQQLLPANTPVLLQIGPDRKDHYGRTLAHLFLTDGENVQVKLLQRGLASTLTIPPDATLANCYTRVERRARCRKTGLWSQPSTIISSRAIKPDNSGFFHLLQGRVERIEINQQGYWIHLAGQVTVGIRPADMNLFNRQQIEALKGKKILVRGWLHHSRHGGFYMRIHHPLAIEVVHQCS